MHGHYHCSEHPHQKHKRKNGVIARTAVLLIGILLSLQGCGKPQAGTIYGPSDQEENLYIDVTAQEAAAEEQENRELPEAMIRDSGYTITKIDESDVYPPKKTDEEGKPLDAWLVDYAVRISNSGNDRAMIRPTVTAVAADAEGNEIYSSKKTIRTYVLPGDEIAFASDMIVRGERPESVWFSARSEDPQDFYPTDKELDMPSSDSYSAGTVSIRVSPDYEQKAPSAGRKNSEGLAKGYFRFGELPELSGDISCSRDTDQEAFVTVLFRHGDVILGGETGRVMIPAGKTARYVLTAAGPIPENTDSYEVCACSIAQY